MDAVNPTPTSHTMNPTCTGTSVLALAYEGGVALLTDRQVSYGKSARFKGVGRQYRVNADCIVTFGGDHSDFQFLQNLIERRQDELRAINRSLKLTPKMLHAYLTSFLYYRRSKMNPIWNTLVVVGLQQTDDVKEPYIGVITQRGVSYEAKSLATGLGAMVLNQALETESRARDGKMSRAEALAILKKCMEITVYVDCCADQEYDVSTVDGQHGVVALKPEKVVGNWEIAEYNNQYF